MEYVICAAELGYEKQGAVTLTDMHMLLSCTVDQAHVQLLVQDGLLCCML